MVTDVYDKGIKELKETIILNLAFLIIESKSNWKDKRERYYKQNEMWAFYKKKKANLTTFC